MLTKRMASGVSVIIALIGGSLWWSSVQPEREAVSLNFVGRETGAAGRLWFVVSNDLSRAIHLSSDPVEFRNSHGWAFFGPLLNFSTNHVVVANRTVEAGGSFRFFLAEPSERLPWRVSLRWFTTYDKRWGKVQRFMDRCFRRVTHTSPFSSSGVLKGPEMPEPTGGDEPPPRAPDSNGP